MPFFAVAQIIFDNFEGAGNISTWQGDDCLLNLNVSNPYKQGVNTSAQVLKYEDIGGQYANVRFEMGKKLNLSQNAVFSLKVYLPSIGITGNQKNQISLKLQNGKIAEPWITQSEVIKPLLVNQWQTIVFDFRKDDFINLDAQNMAPSKRRDFDRIVIQINGENNNDRVIAYLDDVSHDGKFVQDNEFDMLIWSDEFDNSGAVDANKWFHQTKLPNGNSWFNGELQHYTNRLTNSFVENGHLNIVAKKENFTNQGVTKEYTSARLNSKFAFKYGRVVMRAKLPTGKGTWPALWMLGKNINENGGYWQTQGYGNASWPECGEIDIMEHWGKNQNVVSSATHTPSSFGVTENYGSQFIGNVSSDFNIYALEWTSDELIFSVNGNIHFVYCPDIKDEKTWPFDAEQYLLLNIAIEPIIVSSFTQSTFQVDYIRVYQQSPVSNVEIDNEKHLNYFPNPVSDILSIEFNNPRTEPILIKIFDVNGTLLSHRAWPIIDNNIKIDMWDNFPKGIYIVQYEDRDKLVSLKVIK